MSTMNFEIARHNMIEQQIRPWDVLDQTVLDLMMQIPREEYVPVAFRNMAFTDMNIPLAHEQEMMSPKVEARMLQALSVKPHENILEVGTGSGYMTAILSSLGLHVYSVDIHQDLSQAASFNLAKHDISNVTLAVGDAAQGWDAHAPYDVIALTGSTPLLPETFQNSLSIGGRLFAIVGDAPAMQAILVTRTGQHDFQQETLFETVITPLINALQPERFIF